jgi:hypothetical protein
MAKIHDRILEIKFTTANGAQTLNVTALNYYRDRGQLDAANPFPLTSQDIPTGALGVATNPEVRTGELVPPPTHIRFVATVSA